MLVTDGPVQVLGGGGGGSEGITWVQLTQAMLDAGTKQTGGADTLKSAAVSVGRTTVTAATIAGTADAIRDVSGIAIPILSCLPNLDFDAHDLLVWLDAPAGATAGFVLGVAVCNSPGSAADGLGILTNATRTGPQQATGTGQTIGTVAGLDAAYARFTFSEATADGILSCTTFRRYTTTGLGFEKVPGTVNNETDAVNLSDPDAVFLYIQAVSYTGAISEDVTASAAIYLAAVPKIAGPEA